MEDIISYHLHKNDLSKLHFEMNEAKPYCDSHIAHCFKPHRHTFYQIIWFKSAGKHYIDFETIVHQKDTILFINKNQVHHFCPDSQNDGILFHFDDIFTSEYNTKTENRFLYTLFSGVGKVDIALNKNDITRLNNLAAILHQELKEKKKHFQSQLSLIFYSFLLFLERLKSETKSDKMLANDPLFHIAVQFKSMVNTQLSEFKPLKYYADRLNVNFKKLTLASKKYLNDTPNQVIHKEKLLEAKRLLLNSSLTIQEIAYSLGYDQSTYFTKVFKNFFNMTPKEFKAIIY